MKKKLDGFDIVFCLGFAIGDAFIVSYILTTAFKITAWSQQDWAIMAVTFIFSLRLEALKAKIEKND